MPESVDSGIISYGNGHNFYGEVGNRCNVMNAPLARKEYRPFVILGHTGKGGVSSE